MDALDGVNVIAVIVAFVTVSVAVPACPANSAEIVVLPGCTPVACAMLLIALLIVAMEARDDVQVAKLVKSCVSPFAKCPIARNCVQNPAGTLGFAGATWTEVKLAPSTTTFAVALTDPLCAVMIAIPADCPVTNPFCVTVAIELSEDVQVAKPFNNCVLPSLYVPVAPIPVPEPGVSNVELGDIEMEVSEAELTVSRAEPLAFAPA